MANPVYDELLDELLKHTHPGAGQGDTGVAGPQGDTGVQGDTGSGTLGGLTDVDLTAVEDNDLIQYNFSTSKWENRRRMEFDNDYKAYVIKEH